MAASRVASSSPVASGAATAAGPGTEGRPDSCRVGQSNGLSRGPRGRECVWTGAGAVITWWSALAERDGRSGELCELAGALWIRTSSSTVSLGGDT
jgi:hypothetical protein